MVNVTVAQATSTVTVTCPVVGSDLHRFCAYTLHRFILWCRWIERVVDPDLFKDDVGTATANAVYSGDANHTGSNGSDIFVIGESSNHGDRKLPSERPIYRARQLNPAPLHTLVPADWAVLDPNLFKQHKIWNSDCQCQLCWRREPQFRQ